MTTPKNLITLDEYCASDSVGYLLSRARAKLARALDVALAEHDITHTQGGILMMLAKGKCSLASELSRELYIDSASMTRMVDRLEKRNLIVRCASSNDRRISTLQLTQDGVALAKQLPSIYVKVLNENFAGFSQNEIDTFKSLLIKFLMKDNNGTDNE